MKAFVTGSTGLLGNNLVRLLRSQGHEVKALVRSRRKADLFLAGTEAEIVPGDMQDVGAFAGALEGCDVLFHGAAFFREYFQPGDHWATLQRINVDAVLELFAAAEAKGVKRTIFVGSAGIIGSGPDGAPGNESSAPPPIAYENLYFKSKILAEEAIRSWLPGRRLEVVSILPGWMFGPHDIAPTSSGQIVQDYLASRLPGMIPGGGSVVDVRDVASAMIAAVTRGRNGERYIVGGQATTLAEIMACLETVSGVPCPRRKIPYPAALAIAWCAETAARLRRQPTLMTVNGIRSLQHIHRLDSAKAQAELGVSFRPLAETLADEVAWFRTRSAAEAELPVLSPNLLP